MRVLLVEDDRRFAAALTTALRRSGYEVDHVRTAAAALAAARAATWCCSTSACPTTTASTCAGACASAATSAIIMLTARAEERDRVIGLRCGADDYVVKPFGFAELQARIEAVLRRARPAAGGRAGRRATCGSTSTAIRPTSGDEPIDLTRKEFEVLAILTAQPEVRWSAASGCSPRCGTHLARHVAHPRRARRHAAVEDR